MESIGDIKIKIGLDLDGVVCDFFGRFIEEVNNTYGTHFTKADWTDYYFSNSGLPRDHMKRMFRDSMKYLDELEPMEGALEGISKLNEDHTIHIVTHRFLEGRLNTLKWLDNNKVEFDTLSFTPNKGSLAYRLGLDVVVEDTPEMAIDIANNGVKTLLYANLYNHIEHPLISRVNTWKDITQILT